MFVGTIAVFWKRFLEIPALAGRSVPKKILLTTGEAVQYYLLSSDRLSSCAVALGDVR